MTEHSNGNYSNHHRAAELHDSAAHNHRVAAVAREKNEHPNGHEQSRQALEHSRNAYLATQSHGVAGGVALFAHAEVAVLAHKFWQDRGCLPKKTGTVPHTNYGQTDCT